MLDILRPAKPVRVRVLDKFNQTFLKIIFQSNSNPKCDEFENPLTKDSLFRRVIIPSYLTVWNFHKLGGSIYNRRGLISIRLFNREQVYMYN